jgi:hypothetical protein
MMQLFTEEGWSIVTNKKRVGLLVLVGGDGPDPAPLVPQTDEAVEKVRREDSSVRCLDEPPNSDSCIAFSLHVFLTLFISLAFVAVVVV